MVRVVQKENNKPINVAICGIKSTVFAQYQQELQGIGYQLSFEPNVQEAGRASGSDICIVDISALEPSNQLLQNKNLPFLVYGIKELPTNEQVVAVLYSAVGYFIEEPSASSICLNIQLGLHRHRERENYLRRVQDITIKIENNRLNGIATGLLMSKTGLSADYIFDEIKTVSRHKQQRVSDVANKIIHSLSSEITSTEKKKTKPKPICNLTLWLEENIFNKNRK
jgi:AmiR/NasT family two-component response regulator